MSIEEDNILKALYQEADNCQFLILSALADRHLERGEDDLAIAYRWMTKTKRWPSYHFNMWKWYSWTTREENYWNTIKDADSTLFPSYLSGVVMVQLYKSASSLHYPMNNQLTTTPQALYPTVHDALCCAAQALATTCLDRINRQLTI